MNTLASPPDRRHFLGWAGLSAAFFAAHGCGLSGATGPNEEPLEEKVTEPRIRSLELLTAAPLDRMREFYHKTLGLRLIETKEDRFTIGGGSTSITFVKCGADDGKPFYHFAFNIPENKILSARTWQKERTPLLPIPDRLRDPKYPEDVVDYSHWNAHSIFFFDPAGNVVEYIARHDLKNKAGGDFGSEDILCASEIAFVFDDVADTATKLKEVVGVEQYKGASDQFTALGDEHGLLLVMKRGRVISFDAEDKKAVTVFRTTATVHGAKATKYGFAKFPYAITVDS